MDFNLQSELWTIQSIKKLIQNDTDLLKMSFAFGVKLTPLRKIITGKSVSKYFIKKLYYKLNEQIDLDEAFNNSFTVKRLLSIYRMYKVNRTLAKVAKELGLTRERIRQLLDKGTKLGLFDYHEIKQKKLPDISKEKLLEDYRKCLHLREVAKINKISYSQLSELLHYYQIKQTTLDTIRFEGEKSKCIQQYDSLVEESGHHLSSFELQKTQQGHYLSYKIIRFWGSIHTFRKELHIPFIPKYGIPFNGVDLKRRRRKALSQMAKDPRSF